MRRALLSVIIAVASCAAHTPAPEESTNERRFTAYSWSTAGQKQQPSEDVASPAEAESLTNAPVSRLHLRIVECRPDDLVIRFDLKNPGPDSLKVASAKDGQHLWNSPWRVWGPVLGFGGGVSQGCLIDRCYAAVEIPPGEVLRREFELADDQRLDAGLAHAEVSFGVISPVDGTLKWVRSETTFLVFADGTCRPAGDLPMETATED